MRLEPNWKFKNLDNLEKTNWAEPPFGSKLVQTIHKLRKVPLNEFEVEDMRIMIGQNISLKFLIPLAIEQLQIDLFVDGDLFEGDLLQAVLEVDDSFWMD
ncbi:hypothetical protein E1176_00235, partial [Fulvivirga sp. RKSG066]|uniref:contact-dependent growth inhibition system immunity protein n=1 Tax=Fulvivirga aurantia TaxID=2529383 RepID=UPI0012BC54C4